MTRGGTPFPSPSLTPTPPPGPSLHLFRRHYYTCGSLTLSWEPQWYTEPFYTLSSSSYDAAASTGPVDPPLSIITTVSSCEAALSSQAASLSGEGEAGTTVTTERVATVTSAGSAVLTTRTRVVTTTVPLSTVTGYPSPTTSTSTVATTAFASSSSVAVSASVSVAPASTSAAGVLNTNTCAGSWDWQAWGAVSGLATGVVIGGLLWLLWVILRPRIPGLYSPRTFLVKWTWSLFLLPFLHLPSDPTQSAGSLFLHPTFAALRLSAIGSLLALGAGLPLIIANVPCLSSTAPPNTLGGRLGSLTDLSLLRLLDALDPSPGTSSTAESIRLIQTQPHFRRALTSTIGPVIPSARIRMILVLVLIGVFGVIGGLWIVARTYASLAKYRAFFRDKVCGGLELVVVPAAAAPGWRSLSEERIRKSFDDLTSEQFRIVGLFAIPDTAVLREQVWRRAAVLNQLEEAEARFIESFRPKAALTKASHPARPGKQGGRLLGDDQALKDPPSQSRPPPVPIQPEPDSSSKVDRPAEPQSRFVEINRNSALYGGRFEIGQRIRRSSTGRWVVDPSTSSSEGSDRLEPGSADAASSNHSRNPSSGHIHAAEENPWADEGAEPHLRPGPAHKPEVSSPPAQASAYPSRDQSALASPVGQNSEINPLRAELQNLNAMVLDLQQRAFAVVTSGGRVRGWIVVGKGVRRLPGAKVVEGWTREDIIWRNVGKQRTAWFWVNVVLLGFALGLAMIPFLGLSVASAPGFAHYLGFLEPLERINGLGAGVAEGLVPALVLTLAVESIVVLTQRFARHARCISAATQSALAYKATFWLILFLVLWTLVVSALEYAVQGFSTEVQQPRFVGDGAIFSTWWGFVFLLNLAFVLPAMYLLQPHRLFRRMRSRAGTPRQRFRLNGPPTFSPAYMFAAPLLGVTYALTLLFLFPLLAIPLLVLVYLGFVASRHMGEFVFVDEGYTDGTLALWTIRRFGWTLALQPSVFGLILLSRREWAIGGISLGVAVLTLCLSEVLTVRRFPDTEALDGDSKEKLDEAVSWMRQLPGTGKARATRVSDASLAQRMASLLPGYSRLPDSCPLPLESETINDLYQTERAEQALSRLENLSNSNSMSDDFGPNRGSFLHDPSTANRGLIYPTEMLAPIPVVWLPYDSAGIAQAEAADLEARHGLPAIVASQISRDREAERRGEKPGGREEVSSPLLEHTDSRM